MADAKGPIRYQQITLCGTIQGVGFRPFVYRTAKQCHLYGWVKNTCGQVEITTAGEAAQLEAFAKTIGEHAGVTGLSARDIAPFDHVPFFVAQSTDGTGGRPFCPPDLAMCHACASEVADKNNRRYQYPLNTCTACGPRYTVIERFPYDRERTTMAPFEMCGDCQQEYTQGHNRRFHAQTVSCHQCGPFLRYRTGEGEHTRQDALHQAIAHLQQGGIVAVKGIGGYHFACSPFHPHTVAALRTLKGREQKPFAVMFAKVEQIEAMCVMNEAERTLLQSNPRPITLLSLRENSFAPEVLGDNDRCGCFLPYTPLQQLLLKEISPLVMTSANKSDLPIIKEDAQMLALWQQDPAAFCGVLYHDRHILRSAEDSVAQVVLSTEVQLLRRGRGYVPEAIAMGNPTDQTILSMGGDLKAAFAITAGEHTTMSPYLGDVEQEQTYRHMADTIEDWLHLFAVTPQKIMCDSHPRYLSQQLARQIAQDRGIPLVAVQHHHAHIASVMAEHGLTGRVLGFAMDGTGYGPDHTLWGGECLICEQGNMERIGHLAPVTLIGGDSAAVDAAKTAACYQWQYRLPASHPEASTIHGALSNGINTITSTSMGRLFDCIASLLGICHTNAYEGKCATRLQQAAESATNKGYDLSFAINEHQGMWIFDPKEIVEQATGAMDAPAFAYAFHKAVATAILTISRKVGIKQVALSGGVFQNSLLLELTVATLREAGFAVYYNRQVPPNDGGIALGQAYIGTRRT